MFRLNEAIRNQLVSTITNLLTPSKLRCYSGNQPLNPNDTATGDLLAEFQITRGWNPAVFGKAEINRSSEIEAVASNVGTIGWCRLSSIDDLYHIDGTVGVDVVIAPSTNVSIGQIVILQRLTFVAPET